MKRRVPIGYLLVVAALAVAAAALVALANTVPKAGTAETGADSVFPVVISEIMASNDSYPDETGFLADWVELKNGADRAIDISGYKLTDNNRKVRYTFPEGSVLPADGYLVVRCRKNEGGVYADFSIAKAGGESIILMTARNVAVDSVVTVPMQGDEAMARQADGAFRLLPYGTPGFPNTEAGRAAYAASRMEESIPVRISEILSRNGAYPDGQGRYLDWIELKNESASPVSLAGFHLTDDVTSPGYTFPEGAVIEGNGCLVVYCDPAMTDPALAPFGVSGLGGEHIVLIDRGVGVIDEVALVALQKNQSYALVDGAFQTCDMPTPGFPNTVAGHEAYLASMRLSEIVRITEVMASNKTCLPDADGEFSDWIELANFSDTPADLTGYFLSDRTDGGGLWALPGLVLQPGERRVIFCSGKNRTAGELHTDFSLNAHGETVTLVSPLGQAIASVTYGVLQDDQSAVFDASGQMLCTYRATPGHPDTDEGFAAFRNASAASGPLIINEVMPGNGTLLKQNDAYYDWIELKNVSSAAVQLSDYALSDRWDEPLQNPLPAHAVAPGETVVLLCTGAQPLANCAYPQTGVGLNAIDDQLYLFQDGKLADRARLSGLVQNGSYGRMPNENGFFYFAGPTPGEENRNGFREVTEKVASSVPSGVYPGTGLTVALTGAGTIRYTVDGSAPTAASPVYTAPLTLTKSTVVRAAAEEAGKLASDPVTFDYLLNVSHSVMIVSLAADPADLFDKKTGISSPQNRYDRSVERFAHVALFEADGSPMFSVNCGVKLHGASSRGREVDEKRSFKVVFRTRYGDASPVVSPVFPGSPVSAYYSLLLRNGEDATHAFVRDELLAGIVNGMDGTRLLAQEGRYAVLYVNGEYFGLYALKEAFSSGYYATHRLVSKDSVTMQRGYITEDTELGQLISYAKRRDMTNADHFAYVESRVDLDSLIDWCIFEAYSGNKDIGVNLRYYRSTEEGNRWNYCLFDLDYGFTQKATFEYILNHAWHGALPKALLQNETFRDRFLARFAYLLQNELTQEKVFSRYTALVESVRGEMAAERARWPRSKDNVWEAYLKSMERQLNADRVQQMKNSLSSVAGIPMSTIESYFTGANRP